MLCTLPNTLRFVGVHCNALNFYYYVSFLFETLNDRLFTLSGTSHGCVIHIRYSTLIARMCHRFHTLLTDTITFDVFITVYIVLFQS